MPYSAAVSLMSALRKLYNSSDKFESIPSSEFLPIIANLSLFAISIQAVDFEKDYREAKSLVKEIRDALRSAEDIIESYMLTQFLSSEDDIETRGVAVSRGLNFSRDILKVFEEMKTAKEMLDLEHGIRQDSISKFGGSVVSSSDEFPPQFKNKMVGLESELKLIKDIVFSKTRQHLGAVVIHGMGGIGKTSLAISIYNDLDIRNHFPIVAWVKISLEHSVRDVLLNILRTADAFGLRIEEMISHEVIEKSDNERLEKLVRQIFDADRYLVLVDCLCEMNDNSWEYIKSLLPESNNGSRIILVNRKRFRCNNFVFYNYEKHLLSGYNSWDLLRERVFGDEECPRELERIGKRIAENCKGLPLAIITVGTHLSKEVKTVEYWNKVADSGNSLAYKADGAPMFEQLGLSYKQLPQEFRHFLLYMGVFPENHSAPILELEMLWMAEGLMKWSTGEWVNFLCDRSLVTFDEVGNCVFGISVHHAMWHFCCFKAEEEEFFHVMDKYCNQSEDPPQHMNTFSIRRLVVRKNVIFAIKDIRPIKDSVCLGIHSLYFSGSYHPYPLARILWDGYKMLRVLNANSIRFFEFPNEILCLSMLVYLSLTLNGGELPHKISKMRNLRVLIVHFHHIVRSSRTDPKYLPMEIWEMQQLEHLDVIGFDIPIPPPHSTAQLPNLAIFGGVSPRSLRREVLDRIPNVTELRIRIDLPPKNDADGFPLCPFNHLPLLPKLSALHCMITNPYFEGKDRPQVHTIPKTFSVSMSGLAILYLSGFGFPWENIEQISLLPSLNILYLQSHAFRGPKWELSRRGFKQLQKLVLEDLDLVCWTVSSEDDQIFPCLNHLRISHCQKLLQVPLGFVHCPHLELIQVEHCSLEVETWARSVPNKRSHTDRRCILLRSLREASVTTH